MPLLLRCCFGIGVWRGGWEGIFGYSVSMGFASMVCNNSGFHGFFIFSFLFLDSEILSRFDIPVYLVIFRNTLVENYTEFI